MPAARLFAAQRGPRDEPADRGERRCVAPRLVELLRSAARERRRASREQADARSTSASRTSPSPIRGSRGLACRRCQTGALAVGVCRSRARCPSHRRCGGSSIACRRARAKHEPLEQRIAGQTIRAVHAGAGHFARGIQARAASCAPRRRFRRRPSCSARPVRPESRSRARSRPADSARGGDRRKSLHAPSRDRDAAATDRRGRRCARFRGRSRATRDRATRARPRARSAS